MKYGYKVYDLKKRMFVDDPNDLYQSWINHRNRFLKLMSTGKTDKKGIEIFEGAKVVYDWTDKDRSCHYVIKWDKKRCGFVAVFCMDGERIKSIKFSQENLISSDRMTVIGHVLEREQK